MSFFRRAGALIARFFTSAADPAAVAGEFKLYAKPVLGVSQLYGRSSDGAVHQITPPPGEGPTTALDQLAYNTIFSDWAPTDIQTSTVFTLRASDDAGSIITGIDATNIPLGRVITLFNWGSLNDAGVVALTNLDTRSLAANRIMTPGADVYHPPAGPPMHSDFYVGPGESVDLRYSAPLFDDPGFRAWMVVDRGKRFAAVVTQQLQLFPEVYTIPITGTINDYAAPDDSPYVSSPGATPSSVGGGNGRGAQSYTTIYLQTVDATGAILTGLDYSNGMVEGLGPVKVLHNLGPGDITLMNQDAGSSVNNRFEFGTNVPYVVLKANHASIILGHQRDTAGWLQIGHADYTFDAQEVTIKKGINADGFNPQGVGTGFLQNGFFDHQIATTPTEANYTQVFGRDVGSYTTPVNAITVFGLANATNSGANYGGRFSASNGGANYALVTESGLVVFGGDVIATAGLSLTGTLSLAGAVVETGIISPGVLGAGDNPDYAPVGFAVSRIVRLTSGGAASTISGLAGGSNGRWITLVNVSPDIITILAESALSVVGNRFISGVVLAATGSPGSSQDYFYDGISSRWRAI